MRLERMGMGMVKGMVVSVWGVVRTEMELGPHTVTLKSIKIIKKQKKAGGGGHHLVSHSSS